MEGLFHPFGFGDFEAAWAFEAWAKLRGGKNRPGTAWWDGRSFIK